MAKTSIVFDDDEIYELDRILIDEDSTAALKLLGDVKKKVKAAKSRTCGVTSEKATATD